MAHLEEPQRLRALVLIEREAVVDPRGEDDHVPRLEVAPDPRIRGVLCDRNLSVLVNPIVAIRMVGDKLTANIKESASLEKVPDLFVLMNMPSTRAQSDHRSLEAITCSLTP